MTKLQAAFRGRRLREDMREVMQMLAEEAEAAGEAHNYGAHLIKSPS